MLKTKVHTYLGSKWKGVTVELGNKELFGKLVHYCQVVHYRAIPYQQVIYKQKLLCLFFIKKCDRWNAVAWVNLALIT